MPEYRTAIDALKEKFEPFHNGTQVYEDEVADDAPERDYNLHLPPWICQPYIRMKPDDHIAFMAEKQRIAEDPERAKKQFFDSDGQHISRKQMKKLRRASRKPGAGNILRKKQPRDFELCTAKAQCFNPMVRF